MINDILIRLYQYRVFWFLRRKFHNFIFWVGAKVFRYEFGTWEKKDELIGLRQLFSITQVQLVLALIFAMVLQSVDSYVYEFYNLDYLKIPDDGDYVTFLVTISGIGGVFIGLYYAAISTIGGSIYSKVPNNIRDLLAQERLGNVYMHFLSFVTLLGIILVSFRLYGFQRLYIAIPIMLISAGIGIIAFVKLGQRAFYFFDPTVLSENIFRQLSRYIKMVKAGGYRWDDPAFQKHANKLANICVDTLETLSDVTKKRYILMVDRTYRYRKI